MIVLLLVRPPVLDPKTHVERELAVADVALDRASPRLRPPTLHAQPAVHPRSYTYRRMQRAAAIAAFGHSAPVALLAAQVEVESAWRVDAVSHAGAQGLAQIMPATARDLSRRYPRLGPPRPHDPKYALKAQALYMREHWDEFAHLGCQRVQFALSRYNGGGKALSKERANAADPNRWSGVGGVAEQRARRPGAWRENRGYVSRVLQITTRYIYAGYAPGECFRA
ncbi:MAG: transglycosylase SLT domain-containing protein [Caldilineaceae bacterium]